MLRLYRGHLVLVFAVVLNSINIASCTHSVNEAGSTMSMEYAGDQVLSYDTWSSYAGSDDASQYSSLAQINTVSVSQLQVAWVFPTGMEVQRSSPIVVGDVMYIIANGGIAALAGDTGEQIWFAADMIDEPLRGLTYWESRDKSNSRLFFTKGHELLALDAKSGKWITSFGGNGSIDLRENLGRDINTITRVASMTPGRVFENLIILGSSVGDESYQAAPGDIRAYDVISGDLVWRFHTIPHPGEAGYETWPADAWKTLGGANAWSALSIDQPRGIVYIPTGAPNYHFYGANRIGHNLYANSLIALDARTGKRFWHFQAVHHDLWDYDLAMAPKLLTIERHGRPIDAVALATKHGFLFVFDRVTGEALFPIEERRVPASDVPGEKAASTQPFPLEIPPFARIALTANDLNQYIELPERHELAKKIGTARNDGLFTPPSLRGSVSVPGSRGGAQYGNGAVVPDAGLLYLAVTESPTIPRLELGGETRPGHFPGSRPADIYASSCAGCHGVNGQGQAPLFPAISEIGKRLSRQQFVDTVKRGRGRMPAFAEIPDFQLDGLMAYLDKADVSVTGTDKKGASKPNINGDNEYKSGYHHLFTKAGLLAGPLPWSHLLAYDLNKGKLMWEKPYGDVIQLAKKGIVETGSLFPSNSLAVTAGGLIFSTTSDRKIRAWDRDSGDILWSADLPADPEGIPAIYQVDGRQYVVATATYGAVKSGQPFKQNAYVAFALPRK